MKDKKILCICEDNGMGYNYFVKYLKKIANVEVATETKTPIIQSYDYIILFECDKVKLSRFLTLTKMLPSTTKKVFFSQDPHINLDMHKYIVQTHAFDAIITTQKNAVKEFETLKKPTLHCTWGYDPEINKDLELKRVYDLGIAGTLNPFLHPMRCSILTRLSKEFNIFPIAEVKESDVSKVYSSSKIGFNYAISDDVNFRIFETIASGCLLLTDDKPLNNGLKDLFEPGKDFVVYKEKSYKDLTDKIKYYLDNPEEAKAIIKSASEKIKIHTYENRAKDIISFLEKL